ncbi:MAG: hypothetical protein LQ349_002282 [Xanthoria aureola]|nr:MAG: hypothetical protein LQ349_002282 [Xanthoria aureola]
MELGRLLDIAKPRVVTLEQTAGLMRLGYRGGRHSNSFDQFINQFTSRGYNIALKIFNMAEFGLPQHRKRLIIIASCPGEPVSFSRTNSRKAPQEYKPSTLHQR